MSGDGVSAGAVAGAEWAGGGPGGGAVASAKGGVAASVGWNRPSQGERKVSPFLFLFIFQFLFLFLYPFLLNN
jgi:hypothetical protein